MLETCEISQAHEKQKFMGTCCSWEFGSSWLSGSSSAHLDMQPDTLALFWHASVLAAVKDYVGEKKVIVCAGNPRMDICEIEEY